MAPVTLGVQIAEVELVLKTEMDGRRGPGDLARHECLAAQRALVVEQDPVRMNAVGFAIVYGDPIGVDLGRGVSRARIKQRRLVLRNSLRLPVQFGSGRLIEAHLVGEAEQS